MDVLDAMHTVLHCIQATISWIFCHTLSNCLVYKVLTTKCHWIYCYFHWVYAI